jgi:uncharacterized protein YjbI with pentapeptide repeats
MEPKFLENKTFNNIDFTQKPLDKGEYECCTFINCDFSNANLSDIMFLECEFEGCNLSLAKLTNTALRDIHFSNCKMLGLHFEDCNAFGLSLRLDNCNLNNSSFYQAKLKQTQVTVAQPIFFGEKASVKKSNRLNPGKIFQEV